MIDANKITQDLYTEFFGVSTTKSDSLFDQYFSESDNIKSVPDKIEPMVKKLENKGYKVKYSSPGYSNTKFDNDRNKDGVINGKLVSTGHVVFEKNYHFDNTPQGWEWKVLHNGFKALYVKPYTYNEKNGSEKEAFDKWQSFYLSGLSDWIDKLPHMGAEWEGKDGASDKEFSSK